MRCDPDVWMPPSREEPCPRAADTSAASSILHHHRGSRAHHPRQLIAVVPGMNIGEGAGILFSQEMDRATAAVHL